jgi:hypothetical protein
MGQIKAFWDRISPEATVDLKPLTKEDIRDLIHSHLAKSFRPGYKPPNSIFPFEEGAIETIFDVTFGIPRNVIRCARILLNEADEKGEKITRSNAERWLRKTGILVQETDSVHNWKSS